MVKLAVFPKCYIDDICNGKLDLFEWIRMAEALESEGLELYSGFLKSTNKKYLKEVRASIEDIGAEMPMMCYSPDFTIREDACRRKEIEKQKEIIRVTAELGGCFCRVLSGQKRPDLPVEEGVKSVVDSIQKCLKVAEEHHVVLAMENHYKDGSWLYPEFEQKMEVFLKIISQIDSPYFGVQFDPSNSMMAGEDPIELLERVKHRVKTVHASDRYLEEGATVEDLKAADGATGYSTLLKHGVTGKGLNDYDKIFSILDEVDFQGWISIEDGMNGIGEMKESMDFLKMMREKHFTRV